VDAISQALQSGGRLFYVGAGTSGRLASLDAAEIPPTFGTPSRLVQTVIAGGRRALTHAVEGAEDNRAQGARDLSERRVSRHDVVVGIAASGSTPYVLGALEFARRRGAITIGVTSNPRAPLSRVAANQHRDRNGPGNDHGIYADESGTAQKMVLNMLSTAAMVRMGRVYDNWMIGVALNEPEVTGQGFADPGGGFRRDCGRSDTRAASIRTQHGRIAHYIKERCHSAGSATPTAQRRRKYSQALTLHEQTPKGPRKRHG